MSGINRSINYRVTNWLLSKPELFNVVTEGTLVSGHRYADVIASMKSKSARHDGVTLNNVFRLMNPKLPSRMVN